MSKPIAFIGHYKKLPDGTFKCLDFRHEEPQPTDQSKWVRVWPNPTGRIRLITNHETNQTTLADEPN